MKIDSCQLILSLYINQDGALFAKVKMRGEEVTKGYNLAELLGKLYAQVLEQMRPKGLYWGPPKPDADEKCSACLGTGKAQPFQPFGGLPCHVCDGSGKFNKLQKNLNSLTEQIAVIEVGGVSTDMFLADTAALLTEAGEFDPKAVVKIEYHPDVKQEMMRHADCGEYHTPEWPCAK